MLDLLYCTHLDLENHRHQQRHCHDRHDECKDHRATIADCVLDLFTEDSSDISKLHDSLSHDLDEGIFKVVLAGRLQEVVDRALTIDTAIMYNRHSVT